MEAKFTALDIANFYIQLVNNIPDDYIDNLKINKLLYFVQGHSLSFFGKPFFRDVIQAWEYGPVVPNVYQAFKCCGGGPIAHSAADFDEDVLSGEEMEFLIAIYKRYGCYTGIALKEMTHRIGTPWHKVYKAGQNKEIPLDMMKEYFDDVEEIKGFKIDTANVNIITKIPKEWDSQEDTAYDEI